MTPSERATIIEWIITSTGEQREKYETYNDIEIEKCFEHIREQALIEELQNNRED